MARFQSNAAAKAGLDAKTALLNVGGAGSLKLYAGSVPANANASIGAATLLATLPLSSTAFGASADNNPGALATANAITTANAVATGTAAFFRLCNNAGTCVFQGLVGTSGSDLNLVTTSIVSGQPVSVSSLTIEDEEQG